MAGVEEEEEEEEGEKQGPLYPSTALVGSRIWSAIDLLDFSKAFAWSGGLRVARTQHARQGII